MRKVTMTEEHKQELLKNRVLRTMYIEFKEACKRGDRYKFLKENPEFYQMVTHEATKLKIEEVEDGLPE